MITVYSKTTCPQCVQAKAKLKAAGIDYDEVNIDNNPDKRNELVAKGFRSVPVFLQDDKYVSLAEILKP